MKQIRYLLLILFVFFVAEMQAQVTLSADPGTGHKIAFKSYAYDTLNASAFGDTIAPYSPLGAAQFVRFIFRDTSNSKTDSSYLEYKNYKGDWIRIGAKNLLTGNVDQIIIPGDGNTVIYEATLGFGTYYRVRRINVGHAGIVKSWIGWEAVTP